MCLSHASLIFKSISPKTFGPHCVQPIYCTERELRCNYLMYATAKVFHIWIFIMHIDENILQFIWYSMYKYSACLTSYNDQY
jgi:hypothetical protein